jgi:hypothetical protein
MPEPPIRSLNPRSWADPDQVCQAEYRAIHELAMCVWLSNEEEPVRQRKAMVRASLIEMRDMLNQILNAPDQGELEGAGRAVIDRWESGDLGEAVQLLAAALKTKIGKTK